ncbi:MAG: glycosyl hydrolase family 28-related protein [Pseudomonadota bacterium]
MNKHFNKVVPGLAMLALLAACGGGASGPAPVPPTPTPTPTPTPAPADPVPAPVSVESPGQQYRASEAFASGGVVNDGQILSGFTGNGARGVFTVRAGAAGAHRLNLNYSNANGAERTLTLYVNGLRVGPVALPATGGAAVWGSKGEAVALRAGLNTITYRYDSGDSGAVALRYVALENGLAMAARGATLPYQEYEAEDGATNASVSARSTDHRTVEAQSSGRRFVALEHGGAYVEWTAREAANSLVVRYNMPDAPGGGGTEATLSLYVNGVKARSLALSSRYGWNYGGFPYADTPASGQATHYYDESRFAGLEIPAGALVRLQKDAGDAAAYYRIDLVDLEQVEPPYPMPANFIDVTGHGAVAGDQLDDMAALVNAIAAAKAAGKGVWIPAGRFILSGRPNLGEVQLRGAGMWHTELHGINGKGGFRGNGNNVTVADMMLTSDALVRKDALDNPGFEGDFGTGSLIQNVWIEHMKVGLWLGAVNDGLYIVNGRVRNTWADGVNFSGGVRNSVVSHFHFRNTGDDAMAMWSNGAANVNNSFRFNTAQVPTLANAFALYGGQDNKILDNIGADTVVSASGIAVSTRFSPTPFAGTTEIRRNTMHRTGGFDPGWNTTFGALWIYAEGQPINAPIVVDTLDLNDSTYDGVLLSYNQSITKLSLNKVNVNGAGLYGLNFAVTGQGDFSNVTVANALAGALNNPTQYAIVRGSGNSGW